MARILIIGAFPGSLVNFRGALIRELVRQGHEVIAMAAPADHAMRSNIEAMGSAFRPFPVLRSGTNPLNDFRTYQSLKRAFIELQPDVVLAYTVKPVIWGGIALRPYKKIRFYALITGLGFPFERGGILGKALAGLVTQLYRASLKKASSVIFQNSDNRVEFVSRKIVRESVGVVVNGSGVDLTRFQMTQLPTQGTIFLMVARLLAAKGLREYAKAAQQVKTHFPDAEFWLIGPEDPSPDGVSLAEVTRWDEQGSVRYLGEVDDVRPFLVHSHIFVLPSYNEGIPRSVLEAMAVGRPILTADVPGCRETVIPGENGFLVPKGNVEALAERMTWFIENRPSWRMMAKKSRKIAEERFDVRTVNKSLIHIMELD